MTMRLKYVGLISEGDTEVMSVAYVDWLDSGELLTGTPTAVEQTTSDLTIANVAVSTSTLTILGETATAGQAVQFTVSGQQAGTRYDVLVTASTDATPARTAARLVEIICR